MIKLTAHQLTQHLTELMNELLPEPAHHLNLTLSICHCFHLLISTSFSYNYPSCTKVALIRGGKFCWDGFLFQPVLMFRNFELEFRN